MPSQEDYLDNLLKDMTESDGKNESVPEQDTSVSDLDTSASDLDAAAPDLDAAAGMTEDEIERLLSAGASQENDELSNASDMDIPDEDVLKMLEDSDDEDLQDIQELLQKSDNNEAIDDSIAELLKDYPEEDLEAKILGDKKAADREEKKRLAQEKKEQARARKAQRREEAAAKKAEKKAAKAAARAERLKAGNKAGKKRQEEPAEDGMQGGESAQDSFDPSVLDAIVAAADRIGQKPGQEDEGEEPIPEAVDSSAEEPRNDEGAGGDLDLGSLFGEEDADAALLKDIGGGSGDSDFPDLLADGADSVLAEADELEGLREKEAPKKQGFFAKILNFLTEEDEEENENIKLSKENQDILNDLDREDKTAKGKKGKKGKGKGKDAKKIEEKPKKAAKPKKPQKPKKEKPPKETSPVSEKKLSFKKMLPVLLVGLSVGVLLFVFVNSAADYSDKKTARAAYYEGDYQTCYLNLFGKDLNETESIMFGKSESILYIRLWIREFEMFMGEGDRVRALDSLIQTVDRYPELYQYAGQWNAEPEIAAGYAQV